jgi:phosphoribosylanthranilate isomerase
VALLSGSHSGHASRTETPLVKVCGIVDAAELDILTTHRVDFVGLWWGVPGGPHDLPEGRWRTLARHATETETAGGPAPVLVTFAKDAELLRAALEGSGVQWLQLHGYPTPGTVRKIKAIEVGGGPVKVIKVLHVKGGECVEASLIGSYEKAGVDVFLFDVVTEDGRVGSTGQALDPAVVAPLLDRLTRPFLLAGGISDDNRGGYESLAAHPLFLGVDVDTNARDASGAISASRVRAITRAWKDAGADG